MGALAFLISVIGLCELVAQAQLLSPIVFPSAFRVLESLYRQVLQGSIWPLIGATCLRMLTGWALATLAGVFLGGLIASSTAASAYLAPSLEFLRSLPASAVLPIFVLWMGLSTEMIVTVIAFGSLWPVLLGSLQGFRALDGRLMEVAGNLRLSRLAVFWKIAMPNAMPDILAGMRVSISFALILAIVAEMLSSAPGVGSNVILAARAFRSADLYAGILIIGMMGAVITMVLDLAERRLLRWRPQLDRS
jgi:ABC-type nitrate/sulfonate/bicarbonate transport system permease component